MVLLFRWTKIVAKLKPEDPTQAWHESPLGWPACPKHPRIYSETFSIKYY